MPVNINNEDAFDKIAQIEGPRWVQRQKEEAEESNVSFGYYRKRLALLLTDPARYKPTSGAIHGMHGYNRYYVREDGNITFSKRHEFNAGDAAKAAQLGFDVV